MLSFLYFLFGGHIARLAAVETVVEAVVDVHGEAFLVWVIFSVFGTERTFQS